MDRHWGVVGGNIVFFLEKGMFMGSSASGLGIPHPWDLDCIWEQLAAQEAGLA